MPAMLDDPTAPALYRVSGESPFPYLESPLPADIHPKQVTLRDRTTTATLIPFYSASQVPPKLNAYLCELLGREIVKGDTYPMIDPIPLANFGPYWFANFGAIMLVGDIGSAEEVVEMEREGVDWAKQCLGSFYIKPNYPGRSSHVCNGGFLVTDAARNRGVGRLMGECYLDWAPRLGYTYSVFNLVYETNVASLRIWDALGFKRIGRVKGCGNLKSYPEGYIDAIIFGRELGGETEEYVSEERFDKIRFYLKSGAYPAGSDRAEKSRLRSAATHYRLIAAEVEGEEDKLMLKGKEVISDPHKQYAIAKDVHIVGHGGINKTTATIADKYHWVRIKETVSAAIRNCPDCKDSNAPKTAANTAANGRRSAAREQSNGGDGSNRNTRLVTAGSERDTSADSTQAGATATHLIPQQHQIPPQHSHSHLSTTSYQHYTDMPVDPQIMAELQQWDVSTSAMPMTGTDEHTLVQVLEQEGQYGVGTDGREDDEMSEYKDEIGVSDVGMRLREELEASMMRGDR
ncbi:hypothetical protein B0A48_15285 [Cryoendolithus antarcticus]|uniref:N-acetyltransferase domain-containing protein n=1 Tax=Cryoendolithus antarcticus TaxID=1507870 RepID=A0A1V8SIM3_9PEZI|nr:hypothetical protein B0A48_15285 [Cryoendolithus antarcticus]